MHSLFRNWRIWTLSCKEITSNVWGGELIVEQQFIFTIDIKGIKHLKPLFTYLSPCHCLYLWPKTQKPVQQITFKEQMRDLIEEPNPPVSHTMKDLPVEVE